MKIIRLPGTKLTPKVLLAQVLEDADYLESVVIIEKGKDGTMEVAWSRQGQQDIAFAIFILEQKLRCEMDNDSATAETEDVS